MSFSHWDMYKARVERRDNLFYKQMGVAVIRVVEDSEMRDYADMIVAREIADDDDDWDVQVEDTLGENEVVFDMVFTLFWKYMVGF